MTSFPLSDLAAATAQAEALQAAGYDEDADQLLDRLASPYALIAAAIPRTRDPGDDAVGFFDALPTPA